VKELSGAWISALHILAFPRAGIALVTGLYVVLEGTVEIGALQIGMWVFLDAALFTIFGVGVLKRRLWAGYGSRCVRYSRRGREGGR